MMEKGGRVGEGGREVPALCFFIFKKRRKTPVLGFLIIKKTTPQKRPASDSYERGSPARSTEFKERAPTAFQSLFSRPAHRRTQKAVELYLNLCNPCTKLRTRDLGNPLVLN